MKTKSEIMLKINELKDNIEKMESLYESNFGLGRLKPLMDAEKNKNQLEILKWIIDEEIDLAIQ
jgi:hypothetical protein